MPAVDNCEPSVVKALEKEGWKILVHHYSIELEEGGYVLADLKMQRGEGRAAQQIYVVEVKCFSNERTYLSDFYTAVGQCLFYRNALRLIGLLEPVYLAIPAAVYENFFFQKAVQATIQEAMLKLIIVDLESEEITAWIH